MFIKQISYFLILEEERQISAAAKRLGISQSALSKFLTKLENDLGMPLFIRSHNQLYLTPQGRIYAEAAKEIHSVYHDTVASIHTLSASHSIPFRITVMCSREYEKLAGLLPQFYEKHPQVQISLKHASYADPGTLLMEGNTDLLLLSMAETPEDSIGYFRLYEEELVLAASSSFTIPNLYQSRRKNTLPILDPQYLKNLPFALYTPSHPVRTIADTIFHALSVKPTICLESDSSQLLLEVIRQKSCCAFLPKSYMQEQETLQFFSLPQKYYLRKYLVFPAGTVMTPYISTFTRLLLDLYQKSPAFCHISRISKIEDYEQRKE